MDLTQQDKITSVLKEKYEDQILHTGMLSDFFYGHIKEG